MDALYEMRLSDAQWWACDVPGNIGWIIWIVCAVLCLKDGVTLFSVLAMLPALLMLVGVAELISELAGLGRMLRGFGALTLGGAVRYSPGFAGKGTSGKKNEDVLEEKKSRSALRRVGLSLLWRRGPADYVR